MRFFNRNRDRERTAHTAHPVVNVGPNTVRYPSTRPPFELPTDYTKPCPAAYTSIKSTALSEEFVTTHAPGLINLRKKADTVVREHNMSGLRAAVFLVIDRSGSMSTFFVRGTVQNLANRVLAFSTTIDDDGAVPLIMFDSYAYPVTNVSLRHYSSVIDEVHESFGGEYTMGGTDYVSAMESVIRLYSEVDPGVPALVIFQTDGAPNSPCDTEALLCASAKLPIFWQFIGFGDDDFHFLRHLDDLSSTRRVVDNAAFFAAGARPELIDDETLYANLLVGFKKWLTDARDANIID